MWCQLKLLWLMTIWYWQPLEAAYFPKACLYEDPVCFLGNKMKSSEGTDFEAYLGIPYAKPPVGSLRFMRPQPYEYPNDCTIYTTMVDRLPCMQMRYRYEFHPYGSEDCLYLNVYKPAGNVHGLVS